MRLMLVFLFCPIVLFGKVSEISFLDLNSSKISLENSGQEVIIRGFLYKDSEGNLLLANEPGLKSCCIGSKANLPKQIVVLGKLPTILPKTAVSLKGELFFNSSFGLESNVKTKFFLKNASILPENKMVFGKFFLGALFLVIFLTAFYLFQRARKGGTRETLAISAPRNFWPSSRNFSGLSLTKNR